VNSDDGFLVTIGGANPRDAFATQLGVFNGGRGTAVTSFDFKITEGGFYPVRLLWWEGGGGADVEFYEIRGGQNILINDPDPAKDAVKAYQVPKAALSALTVTSVSPGVGATGASSQPLVQVNLQNGTTTLDTASVQMTFDGNPVQATVTPGANGAVAITYLNPTVLQPGSTHNVSLTYKDNTGASRTTSWSFTTGNFVSLTAADSVPESSVDKSKPGFNVFVHQALPETGFANDTARGEAQLRGYLINPATGQPYENVASPANGIDPDVINWNQDAPDGAQAGNFGAEEPIPGIGANGTDNIAAEITAVLQLPAGLTTLVVNSDDGFRVTAGQNPAAANATELGVFSGGRGAADTAFQVSVPTAGFYPIRLIWYEGGGGANVEFFSITPTGQRILVNDLTNPNAIKAFRETSVPRGPILDLVRPTGTAAKDATITVGLRNQTTSVDQGSITFTFNGAAVTPTKSVSGPVTVLTFDPPGNQAAGSTNKYSVSFRDSAGAQQTYNFEYVTSGELVRRLFNEINGTAINDLINNEKYVNNTPDEVGLITSYESPDLARDNYGGEILGYLQPTVTADYIFYLSADDGAQFWLSTDENPANAVLLANQPSWNGFREYTSGENVAPRKSVAVRLEAGKKYFTRGVWKEGGGGDHYSVAWRPASNPTIANGDAPIGGPVILPLDKPAFSRQPASVSLAKGLPATFTIDYVSAQGGATIQWLRNGAPIAGATGKTYTITAAALADNNAKFSARVTDSSGTATSTEATLTVLDDTAAPTIAAAYPFDFNSIVVQFNEPIVDASVVPGVFTLSGGVTVSEAVRVSPTSVKLISTGKLTDGAAVTVTATGVSDFAGNVGNATGTANVTLSQGFMRYEQFANISGVAVTDLTGNEKYPHRPDMTVFVPAAEGPADYADNYGARLSGWFTPATTGSYVFYISADDGAELWLSTDETAGNAAMIATEPQWNGFRQWINGSNQASRGEPAANIASPVQLTAGKRYYIAALVKEGGGGDNIAITYKMANEADPASGTPSRLRGAQISTFAPPANRVINVTTNPANATVELGARATFTVAATVTPSSALGIQWQSSTDGNTWTDIAGATGTSYTTAATVQADAGKRYRAVLSTLGNVSVNTPAATLSFGTATTPARLTVSKTATGINLSWDQPGRLQSTTTLSPAAWSDVPGVTGQSASLPTDGNRRFFRVVTP